jgi:hypothetical protein
MALLIVEFAIQELRLHEPPTVERAIQYWLGVLVLQVLLSMVIWRLKRRFPIRTRKLDIPGLNALRSTSPGFVLAHQLSWDPAEYPRSLSRPFLLDDLAGHRHLYGLIAIDATTEELVFRGVPLLAAITLGFSPIAAVTVGTLIWAFGHEIRKIPNVLLAGAFYVWLWLSGAWYLAITFHVVTNTVAHTWGRLVWWSESGRYPT